MLAQVCLVVAKSQGARDLRLADFDMFDPFAGGTDDAAVELANLAGGVGVVDLRSGG